MRIFQKIYDIVHVHVCYNNYYYVIEDFIEDFHFDIITLDTASLVLNHSHGHPTYHIPAESVMSTWSLILLPALGREFKAKFDTNIVYLLIPSAGVENVDDGGYVPGGEEIQDLWAVVKETLDDIEDAVSVAGQG